MPELRKARIATASLAGCFGCHMALLDIDERLIELMKLVEFDRSPLNDIKKFTQRCDIGIVEGGCCNEENVYTLREFRRNCDVLIAIGQCAIMGGLPALRNAVMHSDNPLLECLEEAYITGKYIRNDDAPGSERSGPAAVARPGLSLLGSGRDRLQHPGLRPRAATSSSTRSPAF